MNLLHVDTLWQPHPVCTNTRLRRWLLDRGSLTHRIQSRCDQFGVTVLSQRIAAIGREERAIVGAHPGVHCMVREVSLNCGSRPMVFAHSVIEPRALRGPWHALKTLGTRPLGAALFADPKVKRYPLHFQQLSRRHVLYHRAAKLLVQPPAHLWARRSLFVLRRSRLLVTEVFLPAVLELAP